MAKVRGRAGSTQRRRFWWGILKALRLGKRAEAKAMRDGRGYYGEKRVGAVLDALGNTWRVYHDLDLGGENADHVVVGTRGVYAIEAKNYRGRVSVTPSGLFTHGKRNDKIVRQAHRQAHKLRELLGVEVQPLLVFVHPTHGGDRVGRLPVVSVDTLAGYLQAQERCLEYEQARALFTRLDALVRAA